ncbi:hypothetical protein bpuCAU1_001705 (plasmid) [Borrelia puertoricensis]
MVLGSSALILPLPQPRSKSKVVKEVKEELKKQKKLREGYS